MTSIVKAETWEAAFSARADLGQYGDNAIGLFALALRFNVEDVSIPRQSRGPYCVSRSKRLL